MPLLYPVITFRQLQEGGKIGTPEFPGYKCLGKNDPTVGVPSTFGFSNFNFRVPETYAYLSGTWKLKCTNQKLTKSGTRTCLVQMIVMMIAFIIALGEIME